MAEKKIRLLPVQAEKLDAQFNLLDIDIPSGMVVRNSKSYLSLFVEVNPTDANTVANLPADSGGVGVYNVEAVIQTGNGNTGTDFIKRMTPIALVKNATLISENKGMLENIRDVNKLRLSQQSLKMDFQDNRGDNHIGLGEQVKLWGFISPFIEKGNRDVGIQAEKIAEKEVRIYLKDIFNMFQGSQDFNTNYLGKCRVHLELDLNRLAGRTCYNNESNNDVFSTATTGYGLVDDTATAGALTQIRLSKTYLHDNLDEIPFYEGQKIRVIAGTLDGGAIPGVNRKITQIDFAGDKFTLTVDNLLGTIAGAGLSGCVIAPLEPATIPVSINRTELVIQESQQSGGGSYNYTTYTTEKDTGGSAVEFNRQYEVEPEAINLLIHTSNTEGGLLSTLRPDKVRVSINNEPTTNRDVARHTPLYYNRLIRYALNQGLNIKSLSQDRPKRLSVAQVLPESLNDEAWVYEPLPASSDMKLIEVDYSCRAGNGVKDIVLFKEVVRSV